ncbi:MAG: FAD-containing oxidoreductase [Chloroflexi bacterium]|nr:FAD-containing oxidoreductase [Chloroflexota bacterium]
MRYDAIIIGSGQAGTPLAKALADKGWTVAIAEGRQVGGSCINYGCTPTKTLIASARVAHLARRGADYGVNTGVVSVDFARVMERQKNVVRQFRSGSERRLSHNNITLYRDYAQFEAPKRVRVGGDVIEAERIYINTGARPAALSLPGLDTVPYLDNRSILDLDVLPEHLLIIGGGYIGLEYAQAFRRFGSAVTIIERSEQIMGREDEDIAQAAACILENEGIQIYTRTAIRQVEQRGGSIAVTVERNGQQQVVTGSHLLVAVGRRPNSDRLNLDKAGVRTDDKGYITVDDHLQTNVPGIWALGDVNGRGAFTHTSYNDFEIVLDNLSGGTRKVSDRIPTYAVYLDPPLGRVGMSEHEVRRSGRKALKAVMPMENVSRAIERGETQGLMKVLVDAETERFLGAAIFGIEGDEAIHTFTDLMYADAPYTVMKNAVHIHPTVTELLPTLLGKLTPLE